MERTTDDWGFELSPEMQKRLEKKSAEIEEKQKYQKPPDSPYECLGCGS